MQLWREKLHVRFLALRSVVFSPPLLRADGVLSICSAVKLLITFVGSKTFSVLNTHVIEGRRNFAVAEFLHDSIL